MRRVPLFVDQIRGRVRAIRLMVALQRQTDLLQIAFALRPQFRIPFSRNITSAKVNGSHGKEHPLHNNHPDRTIRSVYSFDLTISTVAIVASSVNFSEALISSRLLKKRSKPDLPSRATSWRALWRLPNTVEETWSRALS